MSFYVLIVKIVKWFILISSEQIFYEEFRELILNDKINIKISTYI